MHVLFAIFYTATLLLISRFWFLMWQAKRNNEEWDNTDVIQKYLIIIGLWIFGIVSFVFMLISFFNAIVQHAWTSVNMLGVVAVALLLFTQWCIKHGWLPREPQVIE